MLEEERYFLHSILPYLQPGVSRFIIVIRGIAIEREDDSDLLMFESSESSNRPAIETGTPKAHNLRLQHPQVLSCVGCNQTHRSRLHGMQ